MTMGTRTIRIQLATRACFRSGRMLLIALFIQLPLRIFADWSGNSEVDLSMYGISMSRDWLYSSTSIAIKYEGCVMGYVDDREDMGCMDDESEDGTSSWYMMANCRRAQVAYSVYATDSGTTSCSAAHFKESLMTKSGVAEFAYDMGSYSSNSPISEDDADYLPVCEQDGNGYYLSVGCHSSGGFSIDRYTDAYCLQKYDTYEELSNFNAALAKNNLSKCYIAYDPYSDESAYSSLSNYLIPNAGGCSATESMHCTSSAFVSGAGSSGGFQSSNNFRSAENLSLTNKLKYGMGGVMLVGSVIMFFGILFTNRRKRRALMHRKFRSGPASRSKSRKAATGSVRSKRRKKRDGTSSVAKSSAPKDGNNGVLA